jgi:hypothetical protein
VEKGKLMGKILGIVLVLVMALPSGLIGEMKSF